MDEFEKHSARPVQGRMGENHLPRPEDTCGQGCCLGTKQSVAATATRWTELGDWVWWVASLWKTPGQGAPAPPALRQAAGKANLVPHILASPHQGLLLPGPCPKGQSMGVFPPSPRSPVSALHHQAQVRADSHVWWGDRNLPSGLQGTPWGRTGT